MKIRNALASGLLALMMTGIAAVPLVGMSGCEVLGVPAATTFKERTALALTQVTAVRESAASLLAADKISAADAQNIQDQANNARAAIDIAISYEATDPTQAENRLAAAQAVVAALKTYLEQQ